MKAVFERPAKFPYMPNLFNRLVTGEVISDEEAWKRGWYDENGDWADEPEDDEIVKN